jgi:Rrf2 family protein
MLFSRPCQYAIRALVHLASHQGETLCQAQEIAEAEGLPAPSLAAILQDLVRAGLIKSQKGPKGGFALTHSMQQITLYQIVEAVDGVNSLSQCAIGLEACSSEMPCPLHDQWKEVRQRFIDYLQSVTILDMAAAVTWKRRGISPATKENLP